MRASATSWRPSSPRCLPVTSSSTSGSRKADFDPVPGGIRLICSGFSTSRKICYSLLRTRSLATDWPNLKPSVLRCQRGGKPQYLKGMEEKDTLRLCSLDDPWLLSVCWEMKLFQAVNEISDRFVCLKWRYVTSKQVYSLIRDNSLTQHGRCDL